MGANGAAQLDRGRHSRRLAAVSPGIAVSLVEISSDGDRITDLPLSQVEGTGFFTAALERALLSGEVDVAVHSYKDLPVESSRDLTVAAVPARGPVEDVLCARDGLTLEALPAGARVGTCSTRRTAQIRLVRTDLDIIALRGNVPTRVARVGHDLDAIVLARAGLTRLGLDRAITETFSIDRMLPAPAQGALAVQCRIEDAGVRRCLTVLDDDTTRRCVTAEPTMLHALGGGCLCEYTDHGHCGVLRGNQVDNDATLPLLAQASLTYARAGAGVIAPSGMMDGRIAAIRATLDEAGFTDRAIVSYAVKYASAFYGPFREAAGSTPQQGDRLGYQMDPPNVREAVREAQADVTERADMVMVKPGLPYLDVVRTVRESVNVPVVAYQVSGEYSMMHAAAARGWLDLDRAMAETTIALRRAGGPHHEPRARHPSGHPDRVRRGADRRRPRGRARAAVSLRASPLFCEADRLSRVFDRVHRHFTFTAPAELGIEIDPRVTSAAHLKRLSALGFNRLSMGVQDFAPEVQKAINREQSYELTRDLMSEARAAGFASVNVDLIYGLPYQTVDGFQRTLDQTLTLRPDRGELHRNFMGYTVQKTHDMVALGVSGIGEVQGAFVQNTKKLPEYYAAVGAGRFAIERGDEMSPDDLLRRHVIGGLMCNFRVDTREVEHRFAVDFAEYFAQELGELTAAGSPAADGLVTVSGSAIEVTPLGRMFVRNICMVFDQYLRDRTAGAQPVFSRTV